MLSETQIEQYFEDGYVIPDYRIPEETIISIQNRHNELLVSHPEFRDYCPAILQYDDCLLYTSPSPRDRTRSRMPSSA